MSHGGSPGFSQVEVDHAGPEGSIPAYFLPLFEQSTMAQQNNSTQSRQSASYPSPGSYPSPSMGAFAFPGGPPQQGQIQHQPPPPQNADQYRASPPGSHGSLASLNLPPIRSIDQRPQQPGPQHQPPTMQGPMGSSLPPGVGPLGGYYAHPGQSMAPQQQLNITSSPMPMRYPIPAGDPNKILSGGRHKKEVKRRTKTGCLTCRKRRIKCDEGHPTCKNCKKSKRECLGYDPIFKPQPAPSAIQPAPNSTPRSQPQQTKDQMSYPPPPPSFMPTVSQAFSHSLSTAVDSPNSSAAHFEYGAPIDPALQASLSSQMATSGALGAQPPSGLDGAKYPHRKGGNPSFFSSSLIPKDSLSLHHRRHVFFSDMRSQDPFLSLSSLSLNTYTAPSAKRIKIEELFSIRGVPPPPLPPVSSPSSERLEDIKVFYSEFYAVPIDRFLDVKWFGDYALPRILAESSLTSKYSALLDYSANPTTSTWPALSSLKASIIWYTMELSSTLLPTLNANKSSEEGKELVEASDAAVRFKLLKALITGDYLESNPAPLPTSLPPAHNFPEMSNYRELEFWNALGHFLTLHDESTQSADEIEATLQRCRLVLDNFEYRDVIYSIAVVRHLSPHFPNFPQALPPATNNSERDPVNRIIVAKKFLENEAGGKATTMVNELLCAMAIQAWYTVH